MSDNEMLGNISRRWQYSLCEMMIAVVFVGAYLTLLESYVFAAVGFGEVVRRSQFLPAIFAGAAVAIDLTFRPVSRFRRSAILGGSIALVVATALAFELAEGVRLNLGYWDWRSDFPWFVEIVGWHALQGAGVGTVMVVVFKLALRSRSSQANFRR